MSGRTTEAWSQAKQEHNVPLNFIAFWLSSLANKKQINSVCPPIFLTSTCYKSLESLPTSNCSISLAEQIEENQMDDSLKRTVKPQMLVKKTIQETKYFLLKTIHNLNSLLFESYQKLQKVPRISPFFGSNRISKSAAIQELDGFYKDFSRPVHNAISKRKNTGQKSVKEQRIAEGECSGSLRNIAVTCTAKDIKGERRKEEKNTDKCDEEKRREAFITRSLSKGGHTLAKKMKELEMMDGDDMDHVLDIEEVLHNYSRLSSPVYLDIVDKFFMDMYTEYSYPKPSISVNSSMRSLGPIRL